MNESTGQQRYQMVDEDLRLNHFIQAQCGVKPDTASFKRGSRTRRRSHCFSVQVSRSFQFSRHRKLPYHGTQVSTATEHVQMSTSAAM